MIGLVGQGVGFGFTAGMSPGPLQTFLISTTLSRGWRRGMIITIVPIISDAPIIILMTVLLHQMPDAAVRGIQVVGGLFVCWLAWNTWQALHQNKLIGDEDALAKADASSRTLMQAILMNMLNPNPYIFWGSVTGPILIAGLEESVWHGVSFLAGFYVVFWLVNVALVYLFHRLRRLDDRLTRGALRLSILVLAILGATLLYQGIIG
jgi:threonine/homoserine/homoserine lactone efflux protein